MNIIFWTYAVVFPTTKSWKSFSRRASSDIYGLSSRLVEKEKWALLSCKCCPQWSFSWEIFKSSPSPNEWPWKANSSVTLWAGFNQLWWFTACILPVWMIKKKLKTVSIFRKVVQSSINYSVHVVVSGLRHPHPLVSLLAPNTVFLFWKLLKTIKKSFGIVF